MNDYPESDRCQCRYCRSKRKTYDNIFVVCDECGNKRCPKATNHRFLCTGSNDSGQEGSIYK